MPAARAHLAQGYPAYGAVLAILLLLPQLTAAIRWHQHQFMFRSGVGAAGGHDCTPQQVLLSLGKDATEMFLSWSTAAANCNSEVLYEQLSGSAVNDPEQAPLTQGMNGVSSTIGYAYLLSERDMCANPAASNSFEWQLHRATLKGLVPSAFYRYRITGGDVHWHFKAAPEPSPDHTFTFIGFGDMGDAEHVAAKSPGAASTLLRLQREVESSAHPADVILHVGDLSYADGDPHIWDSFLDGLQHIAPRVPYMVAVGNHEYGYDASRGSRKTFVDPSGAVEPYQPNWGNYGPDSGGECGAVTARRFHMPRTRGRDDNPPFWYGFDYGSVHFTVISTEHALDADSRQYRWLEQELEAVDRCITPWLVVLLHRPMYVVYPHKSNRQVGEHIRRSLEPLLLSYKVDLTIAGHVHNYYRTCPVADEECVDGVAYDASSPNQDSPHSRADTEQNMRSSNRRMGRSDDHGIVHFVIGSAGRKLSDVDWGQEDWCAATERVWGFGRFSVKGRDTLLAEYVSSTTGEVLDWVEVEASEAARSRRCRK